MTQVKKHQARDAILDAAYKLFVKHGYHAATMRQISKQAGMSLANVYVYFPSKYDILFAIHDPWMEKAIERLEQDAAAIADPRRRLHHVIVTLWRDIPAAHNGFAKNIMQALSMAVAGDGYSPRMIQWAEAKLTRLILGCLPPARRTIAANGAFAHILMMAFDGFAMNHGLNPAAACSDRVVEALCSALIPGKRQPARERKTPSPPASVARRTAAARASHDPAPATRRAGGTSRPSPAGA